MASSSTPLLSAALIVRDEEHFLPDCLKSLAGVADEIVVVDTGSRDATCEIARDAGVRLLHHPWQDDFAAARNVALDAARGQWILYIDADERVIDGLPDSVVTQFEDPGIVGLTVRFRPATGFTLYHEHRLFRRREAIRFQGKIHESHRSNLYRYANEHRLRIEHGGLLLHHLGYDGDQGHKHTRNLPLLEARLREEPDHVYSWWHLGQTQLALGRESDALASWTRGLDVVRRSSSRAGVAVLPYVALLQNASFDAKLCREALERFPDHPHLLWLRALARIENGRSDLAVDDLEQLNAIDPSEPIAPEYAVEERLFDRLVPSTLAHCYFKLERFAEAAALFRRLETTTDEEEFTVKRKLAQIHAARGNAHEERSAKSDAPRGE